MSITTSPIDAAEPDWVGAVLQFWFQECTEAQWFAKDAELDKRIRERFLTIHQQLAEHAIEVVSPRASLAALIVVLDQFSRNLFRGDPRAFAADAMARQIAAAAIDNGFDRGMSKQERLFLYMPFEHSEDPQDQARSLELMRSLGNEGWTHYARLHKEIIDRFGRFPHRNVVLGRQSTAAELEALKISAGWF